MPDWLVLPILPLLLRELLQDQPDPLPLFWLFQEFLASYIDTESDPGSDNSDENTFLLDIYVFSIEASEKAMLFSILLTDMLCKPASASFALVI